MPKCQLPKQPLLRVESENVTMTSDFRLVVSGPKIARAVRPIRTQTARPHLGNDCVGAAVKVEVALALCAARFLCASAVRGFLPHGPHW